MNGNADVFVTESAEALVQQRQKPSLCAVNPDKPQQYGEMAYVLPRGDVPTKEYVDQWLHLSKASGEYQRIIEKWLNWRASTGFHDHLVTRNEDPEQGINHQSRTAAQC